MAEETVINEVVEAIEKIDVVVAPKEEIEEAKAKIEASLIGEEADINENIFVTEKDTFDIKIRWYKVGGDVFVEEINEGFDLNFASINEFSVTFKYPSQGDYEAILSSSAYKSPGEMKVSDIMQMELTRLVTLVRKWSLKQDIARMIQLDPNIIKAMTKKLRDTIGMNGIL